MSREQNRVLRFGDHKIAFEPPGTFLVRLRGDLTAADVEQMFAELSRAAAGAAPLYWLADISRLGTIAPGARKRASTPPDCPQLRGAVVCGGNLLQRMAATLALNAARLLRRGREPKPTVFVSTEAEARAWIDARLAETRERATGT